jgi:small conductance mechanosensitive channel
MRLSRPSVLLVLVIIAFATPHNVCAQGEASATATTVNPDVAIPVLKLELLPLTKAQLQTELAGWIDALRESTTQISKIDIEARGSKGGDTKKKLVGEAAKLRTARAALLDRVHVVIVAFRSKGGDPKEAEDYVKAVSAFGADLGDFGAIWITFSEWLSSREGGMRWGRNILVCVVYLGAFWILARLLGFAVRRAVTRVGHASGLLVRFLVSLTRKLVMVVGFVLAASALQIDIGPMLAAIGAAGFILAFALQDTLGNFAAGIMILLYRPFDVGDEVNIAGVNGKVTDTNLVSTTIMTFNNQVIVVPNKSIWGGVITNVTGSTTRRVDMVFGIGYEDDIDKAHAMLEKIVKSHELVLDDPKPLIRLHELADSSVNFIVRPWAKTSDYWQVYWDVTRQVKKRFDAEGISIPYPQQDVHMYQANPT